MDSFTLLKVNKNADALQSGSAFYLELTFYFFSKCSLIILCNFGPIDHIEKRINVISSSVLILSSRHVP
jgi:hypothetical protein